MQAVEEIKAATKQQSVKFPQWAEGVRTWRLYNL